MLNYICSSNEDKTPLILIHGIAGTSKIFEQQINKFGKHYYVISIDLPGYGRSSMLENTSISSYANAVYDFLIFHKIHSPILLGHSLGGMIVQKIIADYPSYAKASILVGTASKFGGNDPNWQKEFINSRLRPLNEGKTLKDISKTTIANIVGPKTNKKTIDLASNIMSSISDRSYRVAINSLIGFDLKDKLSSISIPTLLIAGENDNQAPAKMMQRMSENIKNSQLVIIKDCGHLINIEKPDDFNDAIKEFFIKHNF